MILLFSTPTRLHNSSLVLSTSVLYYHADACLLWKRKFLLITPQIHVDVGIKIILITWINISKRLPRPVLFSGLCKIILKLSLWYTWRMQYVVFFFSQSKQSTAVITSIQEKSCIQTSIQNSPCLIHEWSKCWGCYRGTNLRLRLLKLN